MKKIIQKIKNKFAKKNIKLVTSCEKKDAASDYLNIQNSLGYQKTKDDIEKDFKLISEIRKQKFKRLRPLFVCPYDGAKLEDVENGLECPKCNRIYEIQDNFAINFLDEELKKEFAITETDVVSAISALQLAEPMNSLLIQNPESICLDLGCGYKTPEFIEKHPWVINYDIANYPSTDVFGIGEKLPFDDNTFDYVYSYNVLEHVSNPIACAEEMKRVLKPGGKVFCNVPFLVPYHPCPNHYFNMTHQGLKNLFKEFEVEFLPNENPIRTLTSVCYFWQNGLHNEKEKEAFNNITLKEMADAYQNLHFENDTQKLSEQPWVKNIHPVMAEIIAWDNAILAQKTLTDKSTGKIKFPPSKLANKYLKGLKGVEIGASAHNSFYLDTINVDIMENYQSKCSDDGQDAKVDVISAGDDLPFKDNSVNFVLSSHVFEHFFDPIKTLKEWQRVVKSGGYIFMIIPHKERTFDSPRERTTLDELIKRHNGELKNEIERKDYHHSVWITEDVLELCKYLDFNVVEYQDVDDKVGNGFTIVIKK